MYYANWGLFSKLAPPRQLDGIHHRKKKICMHLLIPPTAKQGDRLMVRQTLAVTHRLHGLEQPFPLGWGQVFPQSGREDKPALTPIIALPAPLATAPSPSFSFSESQLTLSPETALGETLHFHAKCVVK